MAEHSIRLNPRNPGQFFACCGLVELAELTAPGGEAWFENEGRVFRMATDATLPPRGLKLEPPGNKGKPDPLEPLALAVNRRKLDLNWWLNDTMTDKSAFKTWGGQQTPRRVLEELLGLARPEVVLEELFEFSAYTKSRFGVDSRSAWDAIDTGYSPNDLAQDATTFPWVEVLAVAGLQGFRPAPDGRYGFRYGVWLSRLPVAISRAAMGANWPDLPVRKFRFEVVFRGQGYKTFLFAKGVENV